jgi:Phospholipase_D-nuclease N-terminal
VSAPTEVDALNRGIVTAEHSKGTKMLDFGYGGILGVLILIGDIWAIINIFQSSASNEKKLIWTVAVVLLPLLGLILWFFLGPRGGKA